MDNGKISARITELQSETARELLVSDRSVLKEHARIAFADIRRLFNEKGQLKALKDLDDDDIAAAVKSFKVTARQVPGGEATDIEYVTEIKFWNKCSALEALSKHLGLFENDNLQGRDLNVVILHDPTDPDSGSVADRQINCHSS